MPCGLAIDYDDGHNDELRRLANEATRAACDMRTILRKHGLENELCGETVGWIAKHDREDAERIRKEKENGERIRLYQAALDKLSMDDRRILGL
jgi:hypothetical protein